VTAQDLFNLMCTEASRRHGTGPLNGAFKDGFECAMHACSPPDTVQITRAELRQKMLRNPDFDEIHVARIDKFLNELFEENSDDT
jgi:hypothetical protein